MPYLRATGAVALATVVAAPLAPFLAPANLVMVYLLAVVVVAVLGGRGPSALASVLGVAAFDYFFVPPHFTFAVADTQYLLTFAVMLAVALVISGLTARVQRAAEAARLREQSTAALYALSRELAGAGTVEEALGVAARHVAEVFGAEVTWFLAHGGGRFEDGGAPRRPDDLELVRWVIEHDAPAGAGTATSPRAAGLFLPLRARRGPLGAMALRPARRETLQRPETLRQLETFVNQTALAIERLRLGEEAEAVRVQAETERLRNALLTSVSHDLRTPLATIVGAASALLEGGAVDARTRHELLESVREEAERLNRLIGNLLQMTRLESGTLQLQREWHPIEEIVGAALGRVGKRLGDRQVTVRIPEDLPLVPIDDVLIEQVLVNLLENAIKYTPPGSPIRILATATEGRVTIEVADCGPGLPSGEEDRVFEKFYRASPAGGRGVGLGLSICRGIVHAHGGRIWAHNLPEGGVAFLFTLPLVGTPPASVSAHA